MSSRVETSLELIHTALIEWTFHSDARLVEHVRVNHGRAHIFVTKEFLHGANVVTALK
jgi:hypothetical protein